MGKNILILTGSPRHEGNSDLLQQAFAAAAAGAGHETRVFRAGRHNLTGCIACDTCFSSGSACSFDEEFGPLAALFEWAETLVLVTPLYWFSFPAQLKAALDKLYAFSATGRALPLREAFLLVCAATDDMADFDGLVRSYELICGFLGLADRGRLLVPGVDARGDVRRTNALSEAAALAARLDR